MKRATRVENKYGEARQQLEKKGARHLRMFSGLFSGGEKDEGKIEAKLMRPVEQVRFCPFSGNRPCSLLSTLLCFATVR